MLEKPRVLIIGCGGIGGVTAAHLAAEDNAHLRVLSSNPEITHAVKTNGLQGGGIPTGTPIQISSEMPKGPFDFIFLATQPTEIASAATQCLDQLAPDGAMVVLANGLCEQRVAKVCGEDRVIGGIVAFGASTHGPGIIERTSKGGITLGRLDGRDDPRLDTLAALLKPVGPIKLTHNLQGARFSKLTLNCAVTGLSTVTGSRLGALLAEAGTRNLALNIMREAVAVSRAAQVCLEPIGGTFDLDWLANPDAASDGPHHWCRHGMLMVVGFKYRKLRSSMLRAIAAGRLPAVGFVNGEVSRLGSLHDIPTPLNHAVTQLIHRIAEGELVPSTTHLQALAAIHGHQA